jgi:hypothetical protein
VELSNKENEIIEEKINNKPEGQYDTTKLEHGKEIFHKTISSENKRNSEYPFE